jgi:hypothetical protein
LIIFPASAVSIISSFFGARPLSSEKRSRDPSWQVMVISHVAISATWGAGASASRRLCSVTKPFNFFHRVDGPADHLHGRSYLLFRRQPLPSQTQPLATWRSPSKRRPHCSKSQAGRHRRRFCNRRSPPLPLSLALCSRRCRVLDVQPMRRTPTTIGRTEPLGHDALAAESARMAGRRVLRQRRRCTHCRGVLWAQHRQKFHKAPPVLA